MSGSRPAAGGARTARGATARGAMLLLAAGILPLASPAMAQQDGPLILTPPDMRAPAAPRPDDTPPRPEGGEAAADGMLDPTAPTAPPPDLGPARVIAPPPGGLAAPATDDPATETDAATPDPGASAYGLLTPHLGGLPRTMWQGTPPERVSALLEALPLTVPSPVVADLRRRLLLSEQDAPAGLSPRALLLTRLQRLNRLGAEADVVVAMADPLRGDLAADRIRLRADLVEARDDRACALARAEGAQREAAVWQQVLVHCDLVDGARERALLGLSVLREMTDARPQADGAGDDDGPSDAFFLLAERLAGMDSPPPDTMAGASAVAYRLLRRLPDVNGPPDAARPSEPWTTRALALAGNGPPALRAGSAEYAAAVGALAGEALGEAWLDLNVDPRDLETPVSRVVLGGTALDRALAYAILARETDPVRLAEGLAHPLETSRTTTPALYPLHARLYAPLLRRLDIDAGIPAFLGAPGGRALFTAGAYETGLAWLKRLERQGRAGDAGSDEAVALLWPVAAVVDGGLSGVLPPERLLLWRQALAARLGDSAEARRALDRAHVVLLRLFEALGAPVRDGHWQPIRANRVFVEALSDEDGFTDADRLAALADAAADGRVGETVALALLALGPEGPAGASMATLAAVIEALRVVDLEGPARRVALEALVTQGAQGAQGAQGG